jgi:hypothetical protein
MKNTKSGLFYPSFTTLAAGALLWTVCFSAALNAQRAAAPARIDAGTTITVRTNEEIDASDSDGQVFTGIVEKDVIGKNRKVVIPKRSDVELTVKRLSDNEVALDLDAVTVNGRRYAIETEENILDSDRKEGIGKNERTGKYVGGGAILGAIIGGIAGGGKGAAIGAGAGAAAGAGTQVLTRGEHVKVPSETLLTFRLAQPLRASR